MKVKNPFFSKTLWVNFLLSGLAFFPSVVALVTPEYMLAGVGLINIVLRLVTKDKIGLE